MLIIEGSQEARVHGVRVLNHCVFCFTKLCNGREEERLYPGTVRKYVRKTPVLEMLERKAESKSTEVNPITRPLTEYPTVELNRIWRGVVQKSHGVPLTFPKTPPICVHCGMFLQRIHEKMKQLEEAITTFRTAMKCCGKDGSKAEEKFFTFLRHLKEAQVEDASRRATLNFLEKIGHGEMKEEDYRLWFSKDSKTGVPTPPEIIDITTSKDSETHQVKRLKLSSEAGREETHEEPEVVVLSPGISLSSLLSSPTPLPDPLAGDPDVEMYVSRKNFVNCDICRKPISRKRVAAHVRSHVDDYTLTCPNPECHFACASLKRFIQHQHTEQGMICSRFGTLNLTKCSVCNLQFDSVRHLSSHLNGVHQNGPKTVSCPVAGCLSKFTNRQSVHLHISNAHVKQGMANFQKCPECAKDVHQDRIKLHLETFHKVPLETQVPCKYCPYVFSNHDQLLDHIQVHTKTGTAINCHMCDHVRKYLRVYLLREHCFKEHQIGTSFICEHCSAEFYTIKYLQKHVEAVHSANPPPAPSKPETKTLRCEDCNDGLRFTKDSLLSHKIIHHGADPFSCQFCEAPFTSKIALHQHENMHKGVVPSKPKYICDLPGCGKVYGSPRELQRHKMSVEHLGRREAFICDECGKGYNTEESLKSHHKLVHIGERKFICEDCGESFKSSEVLKKHKLIHTGERPFECPHCQQRFRFKEVLQRHVDSHKRKGEDFKPNGPMAKIRKRVNPK